MLKQQAGFALGLIAGATVMWLAQDTRPTAPTLLPAAYAQVAPPGGAMPPLDTDLDTAAIEPSTGAAAAASVSTVRDEPVPLVGRYQVATWAAGTSTAHGYYVLDTVTGQITARGQ